MRVIVLGAGVVGTSAAWYLARAGHEVTVVERQGAAGLETSFANGGQISVSHAEPWANPGTPAKIVEWLGREDAPLLFRLRPDWHQWTWAARFLAECLPFRTRDNIRQILALALYSRAELRELRRDTGIEYDQLTRGILHFYTDAEEFEHAVSQAELTRQHGAERDVKTAEECLAIEPALAHAADDIVGGTYAAADESGDARKFTECLAALAAGQGVRFHYGRSIKRLEAHRGRITSVVLADAEGRDDRISADAYVVALGSYSPLLLRPLGISIPVYPLKGYSITVPLEPGDEAPTVSLADDSHKLVYSRLGDRLRVAGTAELAGYNTDVNDVALPGDRAARLRDLPARGPAGAGRVLDGATAGDAVERAGHRPHETGQPVPEHRSRDARMDDGVRFGPRARRHRERPAAGARLSLCRAAGAPAERPDREAGGLRGFCHSGASPRRTVIRGGVQAALHWIPAFAGMTFAAALRAACGGHFPPATRRFGTMRGRSVAAVSARTKFGSAKSPWWTAPL